MLIQIHISHLVTIEKCQLDVPKGTTVITGESGVGKSILIRAIELAFGARTTGDLVRPGQEKADICLTLDLTHCQDALAWLKSYDLSADSNECLIRRTIYKDGRSRCYINETPTTLQPLREFSELLINIHGQHEHQALLKPETQRILLDRFAETETVVLKIQALAEEWQGLDKEITQLQLHKAERKERLDYLTFQLQELEALHLTENEFTTLDLEHKQLAHADELLRNMDWAIQCLADRENQNAMQHVSEAIRALETIQRVDPKISEWVNIAKQIHLQLSDLEDDCRRYLESVSLDPKQLQKIEERLSTLFNLARKHKVDPPELFAFQQKLTQEIKTLDQSDERIEQLSQRKVTIEKEYGVLAETLTKKRKEAANKLEKQITKTMQLLSLPKGRFQVQFETLTSPPLPYHGLEKIQFHIQTNPDQPLLPLAKIASGGELSRISLAIHAATAKQQTIPFLIFDEIDVGVSGQTAEKIGQLLRELGDTHQVFCITHVPQVAALGMNHLCVEKSVRNNMTYTVVKPLNRDEKVKELARMLGGAQITAKTMAHAEEMLEIS